MTMKLMWTNDQQRQAQDQGWMISEGEKPHIIRWAYSERFDTNEAAAAFVGYLAAKGDPLAKSAFEELAWAHSVDNAADSQLESGAGCESKSEYILKLKYFVPTYREIPFEAANDDEAQAEAKRLGLELFNSKDGSGFSDYSEKKEMTICFLDKIERDGKGRAGIAEDIKIA